MKLRFPESEIRQWAAQYETKHPGYVSVETDFNEIKPHVKRQGYINKELLKKVVRWKSQRRAGLIEENDYDYIKEITEWSFRTTNERVRIEVLRLLDGVEWPTASVILHFFHRDPYPILDFRAMWSINLENYTYSLPFWREYTSFCRDIAAHNQVDIRTLDAALWQYSKENQPPSS